MLGEAGWIGSSIDDVTLRVCVSFLLKPVKEEGEEGEGLYSSDGADLDSALRKRILASTLETTEHREQISPFRTKGCCCCPSWLARAVNRRLASAIRHRGQTDLFFQKLLYHGSSLCKCENLRRSAMHTLTDYAREPRSGKRTQVRRRQARHSYCLLFFTSWGVFFFYLLFLPFTFRPAPTRIRPCPPVRSPLSRLGR